MQELQCSETAGSTEGQGGIRDQKDRQQADCAYLLTDSDAWKPTKGKETEVVSIVEEWWTVGVFNLYSEVSRGLLGEVERRKALKPD